MRIYIVLTNGMQGYFEISPNGIYVGGIEKIPSIICQGKTLAELRTRLERAYKKWELHEERKKEFYSTPVSFKDPLNLWVAPKLHGI